MNTLKEYLNAYLSQNFDAVDVVVSTERWDLVLPAHEVEIGSPVFHEDEICALVHLDAEVARGMDRYIHATTRAEKPTLCLPKDYGSLTFTSDDIAMILCFAGVAVDRNPIVSFWCFATLLSISDPNYHEASIYWLSAASGVMTLSRRRSDFVRRAYVKVLTEAAQVDGPESIIWLPIYEILLESATGTHSPLGDLFRDGCEEASNLLSKRLPNAVEDDRREIAKGAFPILWQLARTALA